MLQPLRSTNGYRSYRASDAQRLHLLAQARQLGLSLSDCETLLEMAEKRDAEPGVLTRLLQTHLDNLENEIRDLELKKAGVIELLANAVPDANDDRPLLGLIRDRREGDNRLQSAS